METEDAANGQTDFLVPGGPELASRHGKDNYCPSLSALSGRRNRNFATAWRLELQRISVGQTVPTVRPARWGSNHKGNLPSEIEASQPLTGRLGVANATCPSGITKNIAVAAAWSAPGQSPVEGPAVVSIQAPRASETLLREVNWETPYRGAYWRLTVDGISLLGESHIVK
jgi:hypothetical protein